MSNLDLIYESIVSRYIRDYRPYANKERRHIKGFRSLNEAISFAAGCTAPNGNRHPHQYRIPAKALIEAKKRLLATDLNNVKSFDDLHNVVRSTIQNIQGIGPLTTYDISHRISMYMGYEPEHIYLHRGTTEGAKALGLEGRDGKLSKEQLPFPFQKLLCHELEDCLCIYKKELQGSHIRKRQTLPCGPKFDGKC